VVSNKTTVRGIKIFGGRLTLDLDVLQYLGIYSILKIRFYLINIELDA
jgi:hypothetical protein